MAEHASKASAPGRQRGSGESRARWRTGPGEQGGDPAELRSGGRGAAPCGRPWAIVCDFDGTATTEDIGDRVAIRFAGYAAWRAAEDRFAAGELSFAELIQAIFAPVTASRDEIARFARDTAVLRPGLERFVAASRDAHRPFLLVSAGLDVYIEAVLERLTPEVRAHVELRANRATPSPAGLRVDFHGVGGGCGRCGFCKGTVVDELHARGHRVVMCGDGTADRCAAERADLVFARGRLVRYCEQDGVAYRPFETFDDVVAGMPD
jgi:2-hydroxy-3-keto-5-methylthiopentenyl-1-phosphate phosphatase